MSASRGRQSLRFCSFTIRRWLRDGLLPGEQTTELLLVQDPLARLDTYIGSGIRLAGLDELVNEDVT